MITHPLRAAPHPSPLPRERELVPHNKPSRDLGPRSASLLTRFDQLTAYLLGATDRLVCTASNSMREHPRRDVSPRAWFPVPRSELVDSDRKVKFYPCSFVERWLH
jgi:hypothetical protein